MRCRADAISAASASARAPDVSATPPTRSAPGTATTTATIQRATAGRIPSRPASTTASEAAPSSHAASASTAKADENALRDSPASASSNPIDHAAAATPPRIHDGTASTAAASADSARSTPDLPTSPISAMVARRAAAHGIARSTGDPRKREESVAAGSATASSDAVAAITRIARGVTRSSSPWARRDHASPGAGRLRPSASACSSSVSSITSPSALRQAAGYQRSRRA